MLPYFCLFFSHLYFPAPGQAVVTGVAPFSPRFLLSFFIAHRLELTARQFFIACC